MPNTNTNVLKHIILFSNSNVFQRFPTNSSAFEFDIEAKPCKMKRNGQVRLKGYMQQHRWRIMRANDVLCEGKGDAQLVIPVDYT